MRFWKTSLEKRLVNKKMKLLPLQQGGLDSLCGVYSICNSFRIVKKAQDSEVEFLFENIIKYLGKKRKLTDILVGGIYTSQMKEIIENVVVPLYPDIHYHSFSWNNENIKTFWQYAVGFLSEDKKAIVLSIGGRENHYTVIKKATEKTFFLNDSAGLKRISINQSRFYGYKKEDKYIIYPNQCFFVKGE